MIVILIFFVLHWYLSLFTQTFFDHRYAAHKMFSMNKFWEKFFYILSYLFQGSSYLSPKVYGIMHRMHHAYSDTEKDPHSPHNHTNAFAMMLHTRSFYNNIDDEKINSEERFTKDLPQWKFLDKIGGSIYSRIVWVLLYTTFYIIFADQWWMFLLLPIHFAMGAVHGAIVNWFGHKVGYANFNNNDQSKNTLIFDFLMLGELFQNNHHKNFAKPYFTSRWFEIDPVYPIIKLLHFLKVIKLAPQLKLVTV
jgi:stearoyl-CoA desaturase (Delta-9 desaturase)